MTECTASDTSTSAALIPTENIIEDIFAFTNDFWSLSNQPQSAKTRLNSYEESLSSPESGLSIRSRVSSGEDDLENWKQNDAKGWTLIPANNIEGSSGLLTDNDFDPSLTELNAILDGSQQLKMEYHQQQPQQQPQQQVAQLEWTYLEPAQPGFSVQPVVEDVAVQIHEHPGYQHWDPSPNTAAVIVQPAWPTPTQSNQSEIQYEIIDVAAISKQAPTATILKRPTHITMPQHPPPQVVAPMQAPPTVTMPKVKKAPQKAAKDDNPRICHVCGEQAGKHSYYGGQVCPSCRAFFRRSVQSKYSDIYKCSKGGNCTITLKTRKNCQFCRFQACERAGMKRSWVLADGESNKGKRVSPSTSPSSSMAVTSTTSSMPTSLSSSSAMCSVLSVKDENKIRDCIEKMEMIKQQTEDLNPQVMEEFVALVKNGSQLSSESCCAMKKVLEQRSRLFALNVPEFISLSSNDQVVLQEENIGPLIELRIATFFHTECKARRQVDLILGQSDVLRLKASLAGMHETLDNQHLEYEQFFDMDSATDQISSQSKQLLQVMIEHKSLIQKISKWVEDETTFCLMNLILLFNTSGIRRHLQSPEIVESHQIEYAQLLYRYLTSTNPRSKARAKLAEGIRLVSHCRELHQIAHLRCSMKRTISESHSSTTSSSEEN